MTFAVRTITRSATGIDIAHKPQRIESDQLVIGRGSDCDVRLPDLAVSLQHARLKQTGPGKAQIESIGSEPFEVDGKFTSKAELNLASNPKLVFGNHVLMLSVSAEDDAVVVDVTRQETGPELASAVNEDKIFSVGSGPFGKRPMAWTLGLAALLLCLVWPIAVFVAHSNRTIHADQQWSTGPLSKSHAFLGKNCQACHVKAFVSVRDETCLACHKATNNPDAARLVAANEENWGGPKNVDLIREHADHDRLMRAAPLPTDFVGKVKALFERQFNHTNDRCAACHLEHLADTPAKGAAAQSTPLPRAIPVLHEANDCADCHAKLHQHIGSTPLRDTPDWRHHPEFRPLIARTPIGQSTQPIFDRISLVQQPIDYTGLIFSHKTHLSMTGGVARMAQGLHYPGGPGLACADCHHPDKSGKGYAPVEMTRDCAACHSLAYAPGPNGPRLLPHGHADQVIATLTSYYGGGGGGGEATTRRVPGFLERLTMFFGGHPANNGSVAVKVRTLFAPKGLCAECHTPVGPSDPGSLNFRIAPVHQTSRFLPRGAFDHSVREHHMDAEGKPNCESCHKAPDSDSARDVMLPRIAECASCHGKTKDKIATAASGDCQECHSFHAPGMATPKHDRTTTAPPAVAAQATPNFGRKLASATADRREF